MIGFLRDGSILGGMIKVLRRNTYLVEEQARLLSARFAYDVRDPETGEILLRCREGEIGKFARVFRFSEYKRTTPFSLGVYTPDDRLLMRVCRGVPVFSSRVRVLDAEGVPIGDFRQKVFSFAAVFDVLDARGQIMCRLKGKGIGGEFLFVTQQGLTLARVTKKWAGMTKELLTSADHYLLVIDEAVPQDSMLRQLILASALCIGMVVKFEIP